MAQAMSTCEHKFLGRVDHQTSALQAGGLILISKREWAKVNGPSSSRASKKASSVEPDARTSPESKLWMVQGCGSIL
ncbi:hypothetical protein JTE90_019884 [Oedothorax gibbosus]|uniref:Uncharacterized protein n=1 Tax=Oedothorax gibbosus TaxID=931172 RepID=A0AAV6VYV9_9ARAC|nr:hypothetical protein JTE90_019884 [Oedothorax gibbosus]